VPCGVIFGSVKNWYRQIFLDYAGPIFPCGQTELCISSDEFCSYLVLCVPQVPMCAMKVPESAEKSLLVCA